MPLITDAQIGQWLGMYLFPLFRLSAFFLVAPLFGTPLISQRIRIGLAFAITLLIAPLLPPVPPVDPLSLPGLYIVVQQVLIGIALGFVMQVFFQVFVFGMQMVAMQMALGMASMVDPANGINVTVVAQYFLLLLSLVFLASNGHLVMLEILVDSFRYLPVGVAEFDAARSLSIAQTGSWMLLSGLLLALPAVTALLIVNMAFGVMTRAAPQLNIFSLGFPVSMVLGLLFIWLGMQGFLPRYDALAREAFALMRQTAGIP